MPKPAFCHAQTNLYTRTLLFQLALPFLDPEPLSVRLYLTAAPIVVCMAASLEMSAGKRPRSPPASETDHVVPALACQVGPRFRRRITLMLVVCVASLMPCWSWGSFWNRALDQGVAEAEVNPIPQGSGQAPPPPLETY